jgi:hypothetical protein
MKYHKEILEDIYNMYHNERIGYNARCSDCKLGLSNKNKKIVQGPVPIFHVGENYLNNDFRLVLIGKVAYGWADEVNLLWEKTFLNEENKIDDIKNIVENRVQELFYQGITKYFKNLRDSLTSIFGNIDVAFDNIAITNYVHCNNGSVADNISQKTINYCANKNQNGFIHKELEILKPSHVISLTPDWKYTRYMQNIEWNYKEIYHPSKPGRSKESLTRDIENFLKK